MSASSRQSCRRSGDCQKSPVVGLGSPGCSITRMKGIESRAWPRQKQARSNTATLAINLKPWRPGAFGNVPGFLIFDKKYEYQNSNPIYVHHRTVQQADQIGKSGH